MSVRPTTCVVVLSGGLDSAVLLWHLKRDGHAKRCVTINYGQRHACELQAAQRLASLAELPHDLVDLRALAHAWPGSSQTDASIEVPLGHYQDATMRATVVPNRNMLLLSVALGVACAHDLDAVAYGAHSGDHAIYPDCRPEFVRAMQHAAALCDYKPRELLAPFAGMTKGQIVRLGFELGVPFEETWTCYKGQREGPDGHLHCGQCGACTERRMAFAEAGVEDPTIYASLA